MTERIVRETYTKEVKRRNFDEANRFIDQQINRGKYGLNEVPISREEKPRKSAAPSDRTARELHDMKKSIDNLQALVITEMERKRPNESRGSTPLPREKQYESNWSLVAKKDTEIAQLAAELRAVKISLETLAKTLQEEKNKPVAPAEIQIPIAEIKVEVVPEPVEIPLPPKEQREAATCTEVQLEFPVPVPVPAPTKQDEEISEIKTAIEQLQKSVDDILTAKNLRKAEKDQKVLENPPVARSEIALLTQQLREQNEQMKQLDEARKKSTTQLHDEVGAALFELKDNTDHSIRKLAEQVADLVSANENMRMRIDLLDETLRELCQDDETSISSKSSSSTLSTEPSRKKSKPDIEKLAYTKGHTTSDYPVRKNSSSSMTSSSSGSIAVELPPDSMTDGRRPSQAYVHSSATRMSIAAPTPLNPESSRFAEETATKALNDATRIRL